jgi:hypothetical protein
MGLRDQGEGMRGKTAASFCVMLTVAAGVTGCTHGTSAVGNPSSAPGSINAEAASPAATSRDVSSPATSSVTNTTPGRSPSSSQSPSPASSSSTSSPSVSPVAPSGPAVKPSPGGNPFTDEVWGDNSVPFAPPTNADYNSAVLVRRNIGNDASFLVPAGWAFVDETIPSDHDDLLLYDPANPAARIELTTTSCAGCIVTDLTGPNPRGSAAVGLPADTASYDVYHGGLIAGFRETPADGYAVNGVVYVFGTASAPQGYAVYRVALPVADTSVATRILNSFANPSN